DPSGSCCVVLRGGIGDDFYSFNHVCGDGAECVSLFASKHGWFTIDQDSHALASPQADPSLNIYIYGGNVVENFQDARSGTALVQVEFRLRPLALDNHFIQRRVFLLEQNISQCDATVLRREPGDRFCSESDETDLNV